MVESEQCASSGPPFIGWKVYSLSLDYESGEPRLLGGISREWRRRTMVAKCLSSSTIPARFLNRRDACENHLRNRECTCGIYSYKEKPMMPSFGSFHLEVFAQVVNFGTVWEFDRGYRASKTRIEALWVHADTANFIRKRLAHKFKVPIYEYGKPKTMRRRRKLFSKRFHVKLELSA